MKISEITKCLDQSGCEYALYLKDTSESELFFNNSVRFISASIIKIPILLAWVFLERSHELDRSEVCRLDDEAQVEGAGLSFLMRSRELTYQDALLFMTALSDNLCTNLLIKRIGLERLQAVMRDALGLSGARLERRLMDLDARARGLDNWITPADCIRMFDLFEELSPAEKAWVWPMLAANQDSKLLKRNLERDSLTFYHKTGSLPGVLHDWGWAENGPRIFLLTQKVRSEPEIFDLFGRFGEHLTR